jgi:hypothetical protein
MIEKVKEKVKDLSNRLKSEDTHLKEVLGDGHYTLRSVELRDRMVEIGVPEEKISEIRSRIGEEKDYPSLTSMGAFEVERDHFKLTFKEGLEIVQINAPVWDYDVTLFEAIDEFEKTYRCRIKDEDGLLAEHIEECKELMKKYHQLRRDLEQKEVSPV